MPNPWLVVATLVVGLITAACAFAGAKISLKGATRATDHSRREEWWRRFTWAAELALHDAEARQLTGLELLTTLAKSELAQEDECLMIDAFQARLLASIVRDQESTPTVEAQP